MTTIKEKNSGFKSISPEVEKKPINWRTVKNCALGIGLAGLVFRGVFGGITPLGYSIYRGYGTTPVDQVFEDHNGYRASFRDSNGLVLENKFIKRHEFKKVPKSIPDGVRERFKFLDNENYAFVIKDLPAGTRGYVNYAEFVEEAFLFLPEYTCHAEIHLPIDQNLTAGIEAVSSGKTTTYKNMGEVK